MKTRYRRSRWPEDTHTYAWRVMWRTYYRRFNIDCATPAPLREEA